MKYLEKSEEQKPIEKNEIDVKRGHYEGTNAIEWNFDNMFHELSRIVRYRKTKMNSVEQSKLLRNRPPPYFTYEIIKRPSNY